MTEGFWPWKAPSAPSVNVKDSKKRRSDRSIRRRPLSLPLVPCERTIMLSRGIVHHPRTLAPKVSLLGKPALTDGQEPDFGGLAILRRGL
jgi:hypothetical protein